MNGSQPVPSELSRGFDGLLKNWDRTDLVQMRSLAELTTFRIGGAAPVLDAPDQDTFLRAIQTVDDQHIPLLVLGGGSNVLINDAEDFPGLVLRDGRTRIDVLDSASGQFVAALADSNTAPALADVDKQVAGTGADLGTGGTKREPGSGSGSGDILVRASAGTRWDDLVQWSIVNGLSGLEALSGIPGTVGAAPVQNVGAYGHDVSETLVSVHAWDRLERREVALKPADLDFSYRMSALKKSLPAADPARSDMWWGRTGRWVVLDVTFKLERSPLSAPVMYSQLARRLNVQPGQRVPAADVRTAVLALRAGKGMVLDPADHDTWSAGSFFTNPIVPADFPLPAGAPAFPAGDGLVKTSAAWLIDHAGFSRGFSLDFATSSAPAATLSTKHVLALTNRGGAHASDIVGLARAVRSGVQEAFGITLVPEPVGVGLDI